MRLTPRAGADQVDGTGADGELRVRVRAAPADGAANTSLLRVIAEACSVAPTRVTLVRGASSRRKEVSIGDLQPEVLSARWPGLLTRAD